MRVFVSRNMFSNCRITFTGGLADGTRFDRAHRWRSVPATSCHDRVTPAGGLSLALNPCLNEIWQTLPRDPRRNYCTRPRGVRFGLEENIVIQFIVSAPSFARRRRDRGLRSAAPLAPPCKGGKAECNERLGKSAIDRSQLFDSLADARAARPEPCPPGIADVRAPRQKPRLPRSALARCRSTRPPC